MPWNNILTSINNIKLQLFTIVFLTFLAYSNIFPNKFIGDDEIFVLDWQVPKDIANLPKVFTVESVPKGHEEGGYRPLRAFYIMLSYQLWQTKPFGYHLQSVLIQLGATVLVYFIVRELVGGPVRRHPQSMSSSFDLLRTAGSHWGAPTPATPSKLTLLPFITSLLFGLHPIHTEAITQVVASFDTLGIVFLLASFFLYLKAQSTRLARLKFRNGYYWGSVFFGWVGIFYYEMVLILPLLLFLYDLCFNRKNLVRKPLTYCLKVYGPYLLGVVVFLFIRVGLFHLVSRGGYLENSFYLTMLTMSRVFVIYTRLFLWPVGLSLNHTIAPGVQVWMDPFTNTELIRSQSILHPDILFNIVLFASLIFGFFFFLKKHPLLSFGIGWYLIGLLPASYIIPTGALLQERYTYLASFGFVLLLSVVLIKIVGYIDKQAKSEKLKVKSFNLKLKIINSKLSFFISEGKSLLILHFTLLILASSYFYQTYQRNKDWRDPIAFYEKLTSQIPNHIISNYTLATLYDENGLYEKAAAAYQKVLRLEPNIPNVYYQLGRVHQRLGEREEAVKSFKKVLRFYPNHQGVKVRLDLVGVESEPRNYHILDDKYLFFYPPGAKLEAIDGNARLIVSSDLALEFTRLIKNRSITDMDNIKQTVKEEKIISAGPAALPQFPQSYAMIVQQDVKISMNLYVVLQREIIVIKVVPYKGVQSQKEVDGILSTLQSI